MNRTFAKQLLSTALCFLLVSATIPFEAGAQQPAPTGYSGQGAPLSPEELQQLVAPIALYPDALVAQILGSQPFQTRSPTPTTGFSRTRISPGMPCMQAVDYRAWDPSVKALTQFPSVLDEHGEKPELDLRAWRGVSHADRGCDDGHPVSAGESAGCRQSRNQARRLLWCSSRRKPL